MKIKKYTRVTAFFLAVCTVLLMLPLSVRADEYWPDGVKTQSKSAIVMEVNTVMIFVIIRRVSQRS